MTGPLFVLSILGCLISSGKLSVKLAFYLEEMSVFVQALMSVISVIVRLSARESLLQWSCGRYNEAFCIHN